MSSIGVVVAHDDPNVVRAIVETIDACADLYVAGTDIGMTAGAVVVGGSVLVRMRGPLTAPIVALAHGDEIAAARAALAIGAREIVRWPEEAFRLPGAVRMLAQGDGTPKGEVVAVIGARGGVGTSTVATAFAALSSAVALDLGGGGLDAVMDGGEPGLPLPAIAPDVLENALEPLCGQARVLRACRVPRDRDALVAVARRIARSVIVDAGRDLAAAAAADRRVVVCGDDVASARGLRNLIDAGAEIDLVVVRRERRVGVAARDVAMAATAPWTSVPRDLALARALDLGRWPRRSTRAMRACATAWEMLER